MKKLFTIWLIGSLLMAINSLAQSGHYKQADMTGKDVIADAPWRMNKTDTAGNLKGIPLHIFFQDADLLANSAHLIAINVKLKNSQDTNFGNPIVFNNYTDSAFNNLFTCKSTNDPDFFSQSFDQSMPVKSPSKTIMFTETPCSWPSTCLCADINRQYWFFTLNIPPEQLSAYSDIIDIEVDFELDWEADRSTRLRVFRTNEDLPAIDGWYRGDTHFHSMYTTNQAEFGLPLCACSEAAKAVGLDWITVTDHSTDYDNYNANMQAMWAKEGAEIQLLNSQNNQFVYIRALESSCLNSNGDVVHLLNYPSGNNPDLMPFVADGGGDYSATNNVIGDFLSNLQQNGGFAYAAHPFAEGDKLSSLIGGGIWNISDSNYFTNGTVIPNAGTVINNDLAVSSDIYYSIPDSGLLRPSFKGGEIWNAYYNLTTTDDYSDPWNVIYDGNATPFQPIASNDIKNHLFRFKNGIEAADCINQRGLKIKNHYGQANNFKFFISAGSDAHGSFNYSTTNFVLGITGFVDDNAIGKMGTLVWCPAGMGTNGSNILKAMENGNMILSDGPIIFAGIDIDANQTPDLIPGQDTMLNNIAYANARLVINAYSDSSFGYLDTVIIVISTENHKYIKKISVSSGFQRTLNYDLDSLVTISMFPDSVSKGEFFFLRAELKTIKNYGSLQTIYCTNEHQFNSFTNPLWIGREPSNISNIENLNKNGFQIYPNPAHDKVFIKSDFYQAEPYQVKLYDVAGKLLNQTKLDNQKENAMVYDLPELKPGMYFLHLQSSLKNSVFRLIVY